MKLNTLPAVVFLMVLSAIPVAAQTLTVLVTGSGTVSGTGINCGSDCSETFPALTMRRARTVVLTAAGATGGESGPNWGGVCNGTTARTCTVTVPAGGATVSAAFATAPNPAGGIADAITDSQDAMDGIDGPGTVSMTVSGTTRTYRAQPVGDATFAGWSGGCTGTDPVCTRSISALSLVRAGFGWPVKVSIAGPGGRVTGTGIDCPTDCSVVAIPPRLVLNATVIATVFLKEWGGDCTTAGSTISGSSCVLSINGPKSVIARFDVNLIAPPPPP